jgi:hypothetical protein
MQPSIILLVTVLWIIVCSGGLWVGRDRIPGGPVGGGVAWLLLVILGIILIRLLLGPGGTY